MVWLLNVAQRGSGCFDTRLCQSPKAVLRCIHIDTRAWVTGGFNFRARKVSYAKLPVHAHSGEAFLTRSLTTLMGCMFHPFLRTGWNMCMRSLLHGLSHVLRDRAMYVCKRLRSVGIRSSLSMFSVSIFNFIGKRKKKNYAHIRKRNVKEPKNQSIPLFF